MVGPSEFVFYKQPTGRNSYRILRGRRGTRKGFYFPFIEKNRFAEHEVAVPENAKRQKSPSAEWIRERFYNPLQHRAERIHKDQHDGDDCFEILANNGGRPFIVYVSGKSAAVIRNRPRRVCVYRVPEDAYTWEEDWKGDDSDHDLYSQLVVQFDRPHRVFIGVDITDRSRNGNSILVHPSTNEDTYVFIGSSIYSFSARDTIRKYYSNVGNSNVHYPVAIGEENLYFMIEDAVVPIAELFPDETPADDVLSDAYTQFYAHKHVPGKYAMDNVEVV